MKKIYTIDVPWDAEEIESGKEYILTYHECEGASGYYQLRPDNGQGVPGNMDPDIMRYHGWRGTTCGRATYAEGLRRVEEIIWKKEQKDGTGYEYKVRLSEDLKPNEA